MRRAGRAIRPWRSAAPRPAAAERAAAALVPTGPFSCRGGPGRTVAVARQLVRGQPGVALGHLVGLPGLPDLTDRSALRQPRLFLGGGRRRLAPLDADAQPEGADQPRHDHDTRRDHSGRESAPARGHVHPFGVQGLVHATRVPLAPRANRLVPRTEETPGTPGLAARTAATRPV